MGGGEPHRPPGAAAAAGGRRFPIVFRHSHRATVLPALGPPDPRWQQVGRLWEQHAELAAQAPYRTRPVAWEAFQQKLLRLEQLAEAGRAYDEEFSDARKQAESMAAGLGGNRVGGDAAAYSLPLARQLGPWPSAAVFDALPAPWKQLPARPAGKLAANPSEKPSREPASPASPYSYLAASAAAWDWLLADPSRVAECPTRCKLHRSREQRPADDLIEVHFLRMLAEHLDRPLWADHPGEIHRALVARRRAEQAAAPLDARVLYWLEPLMERANASRRKAEDRLFVGSPPALDEAHALWNGVVGSNGEGALKRRSAGRPNWPTPSRPAIAPGRRFPIWPNGFLQIAGR